MTLDPEYWWRDLARERRKLARGDIGYVLPRWCAEAIEAVIAQIPERKSEAKSG